MLGCWAVGPLGCWVGGLLGCYVVGLLGRWAVGLLGCWVVGLFGRWDAGLFHCRAVRLQKMTGIHITALIYLIRAVSMAMFFFVIAYAGSTSQHMTYQ